MNNQKIGGGDIFQEKQIPGEDSLRKVKYLQELINNNNWEDNEQNQDKYNSDTYMNNDTVVRVSCDLWSAE